MLSETYRFIYLHVPKTGGNSIQTVLEPYSEDQRVVAESYQDGIDRFQVLGPRTPTKHATLADYHAVLGRGLAAYRRIISVRHPFARAVSYYFSPNRWMRQEPDGRWVTLEAVWNPDAFLDFLDKIAPIADFLTLDGAVQDPGHVVRYENLAADFDRVARTLDLPCRSGDLPHVNRSTADPALRAAAGADPAVRRAVEERFARDMALFGYG
ncbi:sulfotransferase family 2 domain-containing protein [Azospirillum sp.]|uniref:sulfotransferase family 2 domain-containing protein n=1 Tax=Azospirillum sp. TaxID=34012 RepID=UPI002D49E808|nr:sulfotransferase family 2 domain-containing protein [Azospirillum sp.]HYD64521.1 sulfotransferase family 2 domain-containing protein [Azospirillum sp.]